MSIEEAEQVEYLLKTIREYGNASAKITRLHKAGDHEQVANIAIELCKELRRIYIEKLGDYPSKKTL